MQLLTRIEEATAIPAAGRGSMNDSIIDSRDPHKTYDTGKVRVSALQGVDLVISRGEMVAIMGPSGRGKTTPLNTLSGLDEVTGGEVIIDGRGGPHQLDRIGAILSEGPVAAE